MAPLGGFCVAALAAADSDEEVEDKDPPDRLLNVDDCAQGGRGEEDGEEDEEDGDEEDGD